MIWVIDPRSLLKLYHDEEDLFKRVRSSRNCMRGSLLSELITSMLCSRLALQEQDE